MAATYELYDSKMQIKTKVGTLDSGRDKVATITLTGVSSTADAQKLLNVSGAIGSVIAAPVLEDWKVDSSLIKSGD